MRMAQQDRKDYLETPDLPAHKATLVQLVLKVFREQRDRRACKELQGQLVPRACKVSLALPVHKAIQGRLVLKDYKV